MSDDDAKHAADQPEAEERLHPVLSNEEVLATRARAREKVEAERRKAAKADLEKQEMERLRREEGLVTGNGNLDEIVEITLDLAPHSSCLIINGQPFWHAHTYKVPRHQANSMREMQARGWQHQDEIDGKNLTQHYQAKRLTTLNGVSGATSNAPKAAA